MSDSPRLCGICRDSPDEPVLVVGRQDAGRTAVSDEAEMDGSGYTCWSGQQGQWGDLAVSIPFEWMAVDETGVSSGPIRRGEIIGGPLDGARLQDYNPPEFTITATPTIRIDKAQGGPQ